MEYPTLLHFAAHNGLFELCFVLLQCPGANVANEMKNCMGMTPAEMAQSACHFELADKLFNSQAEISFPHIYDYIHQQSRQNISNLSASFARQTLLQEQMERERRARSKGPLISDYQVPPPPRPVEGAFRRRSNSAGTEVELKKPYLDMSGSASGTSSPVPSPKAKRKTSFSLLANTLRLNKKDKEETKTAAKAVEESPPFQELPPQYRMPSANRASSTRRPKSQISTSTSKEDDDVFPSERRSAAILKSCSADDPFGTLRANKALAAQANNKNLDYRNVPGRADTFAGTIPGLENELAITNELLVMLDEFKTRPCSVKEMETRFDQWRRKAAVFDPQLGDKKLKVENPRKLCPLENRLSVSLFSISSPKISMR